MVYYLVCRREKMDDGRNGKVSFDIVDFESEENFKNYIDSLKNKCIVYYNEETKIWTVAEDNKDNKSEFSEFDIIKETTYKLVSDVMTHSTDWEPTSFSFYYLK